MTQTLVHYGIHFLAPLGVALLFFRNDWKFAFLVMLLGFLIDLDHVLSSPMFEANRCSIGFHPLHSYYAIGVYLMLLFFKKTRLIGLGLVIHIVADSVDCWMMA